MNKTPPQRQSDKLTDSDCHGTISRYGLVLAAEVDKRTASVLYILV